MLKFTTAPFSFEIDGSPYTLPKLGFGDLEQTATIGASLGENPAEGVKLVRELLTKKADARTLEAIDGLAVSDVIQLIREWIGLTPGESSASGE